MRFVRGDNMKQIAGYEGKYSVTEDGKVYSHLTDKFLTPIRRTEYLAVKLCYEGALKWFYVHRLVAEAFCENPHNKQTVNHIDGDHHNNHADNLEWMTMSENNKHAWDNGQNVITERMYASMIENLVANRVRHGQVATSPR